MEEYTDEELNNILSFLETENLDDIHIQDEHLKDIYNNMLAAKSAEEEEQYSVETYKYIINRISTNKLIQRLDNDAIQDLLEESWEFMGEERQSKIIEYVIQNPDSDFDIYGEIWQQTNANVQQKYFDDILKLYDRIERIWMSTKTEVQILKLPVVVENLKDNPGRLARVWLYYTKPEAQQKNANLLPQIIEYTRSNPAELANVWSRSKKEVQQENASLLPQILEYVGEDERSFAEVWRETEEKIQESILSQVIENEKENPIKIRM
ncbi:MAG: hypothetical protein IKF38_07825, partial [Clostridia bacterium]|nr:hypothetical protein [Clostridia bacterium]